MAHWEHRPEAKWKGFAFKQPCEKGLKRLREEVLAKTDFDPATLWQWGTMQAMAVIEVLRACEAAFGEQGQVVVEGALRKVGYDVGRQILEGATWPGGAFGFEVRFDCGSRFRRKGAKTQRRKKDQNSDPLCAFASLRLCADLILGRSAPRRAQAGRPPRHEFALPPRAMPRARTSPPPRRPGARPRRARCR
jgi:hypothetical protein